MTEEERDRLHALTNSITIQAGRLAGAKEPDEYKIHVAAIQAISREMCTIVGAGEEANVMDLIRRGIGWAAGPVRRRGVELGVI